MHRRKMVEVVFSLNFKVQNTIHPGPRVWNPKPTPTWKLHLLGPHFHNLHTHPTMASADNNNAMLATAAARGTVS
jgi:hypothetical protein